MTSIRDRLRALPSIVGQPPKPLPSPPPAVPRDLFVEWLENAIDAGIPESHAITLSTVDLDGRPDARVLIMKDILPDGSVEIALSSHSPKAKQLETNPKAALTWYKTSHSRSIRIRGTAQLAPKEICKADWKSRSVSARAIALAGQQSTPFDGNRKELIRNKMDEAATGEGGENWQVWRIVPEEVEFWQGAKDRNHDRLKYQLISGDWLVSTLWP